MNLSSSADIEAALKVAQESLFPAPHEQIEAWLAELAVKTSRRKASEMGSELAVSVYANHLREYPADAVRHVLANYRGTWFPAWGELADRLDEFVEPRLMIRDRLMDMLGLNKRRIEDKSGPSRADILRDELAALNRNLLRFPELAGPEMEEKRKRIINELEAGPHPLAKGRK